MGLCRRTNISQMIWNWLYAWECVCEYTAVLRGPIASDLLWVHDVAFSVSSNSKLIRQNAVGPAPLSSVTSPSLSDVSLLRKPSHVCRPNMSQGWWSYVHHRTARPHLPSDTFCLPRSLSLSHSCVALFLQAASDWLSATDWVILSQSVISPSSPQISPLLLLSSIKARLPGKEEKTLKGVKTVAN